MSIGSFIKSVFSAEAMGDEIVSLQERKYHEFAATYKNKEPHELLAFVWLARMTARGNNVRGEDFGLLALSETIQFSCLPPTKNARALGLYFLNQERPDIIQQFPRFALEFDSLMRPVVTAMASGALMNLYRQFNPRMATESEGPSQAGPLYSDQIT